jgi:hypothetical protein
LLRDMIEIACVIIINQNPCQKFLINHLICRYKLLLLILEWNIF